MNARLAVGLAIVTAASVLAAVGPDIVPFDPQTPSVEVSAPPPPLGDWPRLMLGAVSVHWFGTDAAGLDVFSRTLAAPRTDLVIAFSANLASLAVGTGLGLVAGWLRHWSGGALLRLSDLVQSFPIFLTAMILIGLGGRSWLNIVLTLALLYTPIYLRLTRAAVLAQRDRGFVECARAMGIAEPVIAIRHVLPNALGPAIVQSSVTMGFAVLLVAGLSFVGAGVRPPTPEWGAMIATGSAQIILGEWWPSVFPGVAISLTVFGFALIGQQLERRFAA